MVGLNDSGNGEGGVEKVWEGSRWGLSDSEKEHGVWVKVDDSEPPTPGGLLVHGVHHTLSVS